MKNVIKVKFLSLAIILLASIITFLAYTNSISTGDKKCFNWLREHECFPDYPNDEITTAFVEYDILSDDYKAVFSADELKHASSGDELYNIYAKANMVSKSVQTKKDDLCITDEKNSLEGKLYTTHGDYYVKYNIWLRVQPFTSNIRIVKWTIDMNELREDKNIAETSEG